MNEIEHIDDLYDYLEHLPEINPDAAAQLNFLEAKHVRFYAKRPWSRNFTGKVDSYTIRLLLGDILVTEKAYIWINEEYAGSRMDLSSGWKLEGLHFKSRFPEMNKARRGCLGWPLPPLPD